MADWLSSMQQTFEYYVVNPNTWKDDYKLTTVKSCTINRDITAETLGSATIDINDTFGECYIRVYLVTIQNGLKERYPLGTYLVQTPSSSFDGKVRTVSMDAYTPLIEVKENPVPLGYSVMKNENIMNKVYKLTKEHARAPVVEPTCSDAVFKDFVANTDDTWLSFLSDLMSQAKFTFSLDELGRILFSPKQDTASLQPVWTYNDDNSSILYSDISLDHDLYGIPNIVEVVYSGDSGTLTSRVVNDDPNSLTSTVSRGREITHRDTNPSLSGVPTQDMIDEYAEKLLKDLSTLEYTVNYTHGYCPVRLGDCVRINYTRAGLTNVKARVISQSIKCEAGCSVSETAVFTKKLWERGN